MTISPDISWHERWFAAYVKPFCAGPDAAADCVASLGLHDTAGQVNAADERGADNCTDHPADGTGDVRQSLLRRAKLREHHRKYSAEYILLKLDHSLRVLDNARAIIASLDVSPAVARAALLAALYHDVGRFVQYAVYRSFSDAVSVNHGHLGCKVLKHEQPLRDEPEYIRRLAMGAVVMHNRFRIPDSISDDLRTVVSIVRDSDKIDIFPVLVANFVHDGSKSDVVTLHVEEKAGVWTPALQEALERKELGCYADMRYVNDFKLLLGSWAFDLNYAESRRLVRERGLMEQLLATWPDSPKLEVARANVLEALYAG